ncbi:hypothetical protein Emed_003878 [Eimeria media]
MCARFFELPPLFASEMDMQVQEGSCHLTLAERIIGPRKGAARQLTRGSKDYLLSAFCPPASAQEAAGGRRARSIDNGDCGRGSLKKFRTSRRVQSQAPLMERMKPFPGNRVQQAALQPVAMLPADPQARQPVWPAVQPTRFSAGSRINCSRETTAEELHPAATRSGALLPAVLGPSLNRGRELERRAPFNNSQQPQPRASGAELGAGGSIGSFSFTPAPAEEVQREASPRLPSIPRYVPRFPPFWLDRVPPERLGKPASYYQTIPVDVPSVPVREAFNPRPAAPQPHAFGHTVTAQRSTDRPIVSNHGEAVDHGMGWWPAVGLQQSSHLHKDEDEPSFRIPQQPVEEAQENVLLQFSPEHETDSTSTGSCNHTSRLVAGICEELFAGEDDEDEDDYDDEDDDFYSDSGDTIYSECRFESSRGDAFNCLMPSRGGGPSEVHTPRYLHTFYPGFVRVEGYPNHWRRIREEPPVERYPNSQHQAREDYSAGRHLQQLHQRREEYPEEAHFRDWHQTYAEYPVRRFPNVEYQTLEEEPEFNNTNDWHPDFTAEPRYPNSWSRRHEDVPVNRYSNDWDRTLEENNEVPYPTDWRQTHQGNRVQRFPHNWNQTHEQQPFTYPTDYPLDRPVPFDFQRQDCSSAGDDEESWDDEAFDENFPEVYQTPLGTMESINGPVMYPSPQNDSYDQAPPQRDGNELLAPMISRRHLVDYLAEQLIPRHSNHDDIEAYAAIRPTKMPEDLVFTGEEATQLIHTVLISGCLPWQRSREDVELLVDNLIEHYLETSRF